MSDNNKKLIWDLPVRIFHWLLVINIGYSWYAVEIEADMDHHFLSGYCALTLILFRILWGIFGTTYTRFSGFLYSPKMVLAYAKTFFTRAHGKSAGHNPLGALSVYAMLFLMALQATTGLFSNDGDYYFGPLSNYVSWGISSTITEIHHANFKIITGFIVLHIVAILYYRLYKGEKLLLAMFTGKKVDDKNQYEAIADSRLIVAAVLIMLCAGLVYALVNYA